MNHGKEWPKKKKISDLCSYKMNVYFKWMQLRFVGDQSDVIKAWNSNTFTCTIDWQFFLIACCLRVTFPLKYPTRWYHLTLMTPIDDELRSSKHKKILWIDSLEISFSLCAKLTLLNLTWLKLNLTQTWLYS